uniref:Protein FAR1-RELATED SEQUENCE n=1 Tax=Lactuca sativa TaxID=4236 RepID=A0A9R1VHK3_LACSA|nr:hypothetical protein LSAT_V11C500231290 [Lactuca sativa]
MPIPMNYFRPYAPKEFKPTKSMRFKDVDDGVNFYKRYVEKVGFDVRMNTSRKNGDIIKHRYVVCNKMGKTKMNSTERNIIYRVTNCKAKIIVKCVKGTHEYRFDKFLENHNHDLEDKFHLKMKMGATKAYKLKSTLKGGFQHVLNAMFWADEIYKAYYNEFRDVILLMQHFLQTNNYVVIYETYMHFFFVPFTIIDHHKSSVTVGSGLLSTEDVDLYKWLLEIFLKSHSNKKPLLVLMDQDPTLNQVVDSFFYQSMHRLCMWHIMKKLPKKELLIKEFNLEDERWLKDIFGNKEAWVPTYFSNFPMCGLMKTTSRSESSNSFFNLYSQTENFLRNFMKNYENAIQK